MQQRFALTDQDIDASFGIVEIDPDAQLYTALVEPDAASRISGTTSDVKTYSNPTISAFDLPEEEKE